MAFGFQDIAREWQGREELVSARSYLVLGPLTMLFSFHSEVPAEVVGSAEVHHLSTMAPFRRARTGAQREQSMASPRTVSSSQSDNNYVPLGHERPPIISPDAFSPSEAPTLTFSFDSLPVPDNDMSQQLNISHQGIIQTPLLHYSRTAEDMSHFLTWDASEYWNVGGQNQF